MADRGSGSYPASGGADAAAPPLRPAGTIRVAEALLDVRVAVADTPPMRGIMLPGVAAPVSDIVDVGDVVRCCSRPVPDDVAIAPIDATAPAPVP